MTLGDRMPFWEHIRDREESGCEHDPDAGSPEAVEAMAQSYKARAAIERPWEFRETAALMPDDRESQREAAREDERRPRIHRGDAA